MNPWIVLIATMVSGLLWRPASAQHSAMPAGMTHEEHLAQMERDAEMKARGDRAMGFGQDATAHHFVLTANGGLIRVDATDPAIDSHATGSGRIFSRSHESFRKACSTSRVRRTRKHRRESR